MNTRKLFYIFQTVLYFPNCSTFSPQLFYIFHLGGPTLKPRIVWSYQLLSGPAALDMPYVVTVFPLILLGTVLQHSLVEIISLTYFVKDLLLEVGSVR